MQVHHPDRGRSDEMAVRINVTYSRMLGWLDRHLETRCFLRMRYDNVPEREAARTARRAAAKPMLKIDTAYFYATVLSIVTAAMGIGIGTLARRQR